MKKTIIAMAVVAVLASCSDKSGKYDATGTFEATEVTVSAKSSGELQGFGLSEGQEIESGQVVGNIDSYQLRLKKEQLAATRQQLAATRQATGSKKQGVESHTATIRQQIANAQRERKRYSELVKDGAAPRKQLDEIDYQIKVLEKQLAATRDDITSNNASLSQQIDGIDAQIRGIDAQQAQIDDQIANTEVKSPVTGTVLEKYVEQGEYVSTGKPLFKMADMREMTLRAYVTSAQLARVKVGQAVKVVTDYGDNTGNEYDGVVTWISSQSEFTPKTIVTDDERADLVYAVKVRVKNDGGIKMGMYGKMRLE